MEAHVAKAQLLVTAPQLLLPVRPEGKERVVTADRMLPGMGQRGAGGRQVRAKGDGHFLSLRRVAGPERPAARHRLRRPIDRRPRAALPTPARFPGRLDAAQDRHARLRALR